MFTVVIFFVAIHEPWFWDPKLCFSDCFGLPCVDQKVSSGERFIYRLELAYYAQGIPMVFLWETKKSDTWQLFAHHVATVILIGYSYYLNVLHVGILVLACHEMNDIFLEAAKMSRYAKTKEWIPTVLFVGTHSLYQIIAKAWRCLRMLHMQFSDGITTNVFPWMQYLPSVGL